MQRLKVNKIRCKKCKEELHSKTVHDFVSCKCGVFNDGGSYYSRRGWPSGKKEDWIEDLCEYYELNEEVPPEPEDRFSY